MELRQVRAFVAVARTGSFARAADELHVSRQGVSKQVKLLEEGLGVRLIVRAGGRRSVRLTDAGEALLSDAVAMVDANDAAERRARELSGRIAGRLTVMVAQGFETWPGWQEMAREFRAEYPKLRVAVTSGTTVDGMLTAIAVGEADVAVLAAPAKPAAKGVDVRALHSERLVLALPPEHRFAGREEIAIGDLRDENWLLRPSDASIAREVIVAAAGEAGFRPHIDIECPTPTLVREFILLGQGIGVLGESEREFYEPAAIAALGPPPVTFTLCAATRDDHRSDAARAALEYLRTRFPD